MDLCWVLHVLCNIAFSPAFILFFMSFLELETWLSLSELRFLGELSLHALKPLMKVSDSAGVAYPVV